MYHSLSSRNVAVLAADGVEQIQLAWPWEALLDAGANVELVSPQGNGIQGFNDRERGLVYPADKPLGEAVAEDYDALVLPGGVGCPGTLGRDEEALRFLRAFRRLGKPVAAICQAPSVLASADVVRERRLTSWPGVRPEIRRAGGIWVDREVVVDDGLITCRAADDLDAFCDALIGALRIEDRRRAGPSDRAGHPGRADRSGSSYRSSEGAGDRSRFSWRQLG